MNIQSSLLARLIPSARPILIPAAGQVSCGFPSPAADYALPDLSLDQLVGIRPASSIFLLRAWGDSMVEAGIHDGDVLVVDKARQARLGDVVVAVLSGEFVVKRLQVGAEGRPCLMAENPRYAPILLAEDEPLQVWGVCLWVLHGLSGA